MDLQDFCLALGLLGIFGVVALLIISAIGVIIEGAGRGYGSVARCHQWREREELPRLGDAPACGSQDQGKEPRLPFPQ